MPPCTEVLGRGVEDILLGTHFHDLHQILCRVDCALSLLVIRPLSCPFWLLCRLLVTLAASVPGVGKGAKPDLAQVTWHLSLGSALRLRGPARAHGAYIISC